MFLDANGNDISNVVNNPGMSWCKGKLPGQSVSESVIHEQ